MIKNKFKHQAINRLKISSGIYILLITILITRLGYAQLVNPEKYTDRATLQQLKDEIVIPKRGTITDRNGKTLAISIKTYDILVEKLYIEGYVEESAGIFNKVLGVPEDEFYKKYKDDSKRFYIAKNVTQEKVDALYEAKVKGIKLEKNSQREYPYGSFASHVIGHVSKDNRGLAGIEAYFDRELSGVNGRRIILKDAKEREVIDSEVRYHEPQDGYQITLTIDEVIQRYVEKVTNQAFIDSNAVSVTSIVMDPKTGEILAMASKPDYNLNDPRVPVNAEQKKQFEKAQTIDEQSAIISKMWRNPAVNDVYEPGSTFKIVTAATGLELDLIRPDEVFYDAGYVKVNDRRINNWTSVPYGAIDFRKATVESVNTVFVEVGNRIGKTAFLEYIHSFGYGQKTGIEIPGEATGIIYNEKNLGPVELATMSFGQGISVTPIQMVAAASVIANDGKLVKPTLIKEISTSEGNIVKRSEIEVVKNPISAVTASKVLNIMESVGEAARYAQIEGYRIAGKSGTAQKVIDGKYGAYIGSYLGIVPVEDPKLIVLTIVDQPRKGTTYGGSNAAPFVKQIMEYSLRYLGVTPESVEENIKNNAKVTIPEIRKITVKEAKKLLDSKNLRYRQSNQGVKLNEDDIVIDCFPKPGEKIAQGTEIVLYTKVNDAEVEVPDLIGKTIDESSLILESLGLKPAYNGVGIVKGQSPAKGEKIKAGSLVSLDLGE